MKFISLFVALSFALFAIACSDSSNSNHSSPPKAPSYTEAGKLIQQAVESSEDHEYFTTCDPIPRGAEREGNGGNTLIVWASCRVEAISNAYLERSDKEKKHKHVLPVGQIFMGGFYRVDFDVVLEYNGGAWRVKDYSGTGMTELFGEPGAGLTPGDLHHAADGAGASLRWRTAYH